MAFRKLIILITVLIVAIGLVSWHFSHHEPVNRHKPADVVSQKKAQTDPFVGWKTAVSDRAKFSIRYPASWNYSQSIGPKDNIEHLTLTSQHFRINIDSYKGGEVILGGTTATICGDCQTKVVLQQFTAGKIGNLQLDSATYSLDSGQGNALVLESPGSIYYLPSPTDSNIKTTFRAISIQPSEAAYQAETAGQFKANPDFATAEKILESVRY